MCGICGIVNKEKNNAISKDVLLAMRDTMIHRGPDDEGFYINKSIGLGHRRLSIIDLETGHQPMSNEDGTIWIAYNGEIYNFKEEKLHLENKGHIFATRSDTEMIIHAYEEYGVECLKRFNGMFAFAIWDDKKSRLFLARDRLGIKPLYYTLTKDYFLFASEIKAIIKHPGVARRFNDSALSEYVAFRYVSGESTFFKNIYCLLPGHFMIYENHDLTFREYWDIQSNLQINDTRSLNGYVNEFDELIKDSIQLRLLSDVPLGTFNSGGIDSSLVTAIASGLKNDAINSFSVGFHENDFDESAFAHIVSDKYNTNHHEIKMSNQEFSELLPAMIYYNDEPLNHPNSIQLYGISKFAKRFVTVVLTGEGADELFAGYPRYNIPSLYFKYKKLPHILRSLLLFPLNNINDHRIKKFLQFTDKSPRDVSIFNSAFVENSMINNILSEHLRNYNSFHYRDSMLGKLNSSFMNQFLYLELKTYLVSILNRQDKMSMAASIEARVPYLDYRIVEKSFLLPFSFKIKRYQNKYILRHIADKYLPSVIINRKKAGFGVPLAKWFNEKKGLGELKEILFSKRTKERGLFESKFLDKIKEWEYDHIEQNPEIMWELINIELWHRIFIDGDGTSLL